MKERSLDVVILAAGPGARLGGSSRKAFHLVGQKPLLQFSLETIIAVSYVRQVIIVIHPHDRRRLEDDILNNLILQKPIHVTDGGVERQDSALAGVREAGSSWVAVHDAARPFFTADLLERVYLAALEARAAIPTLPVTESLRRISSTSFITEDISRDQLHFVQTPQCFERELLHSSLERACREGRYFSDEAGAVLAMDRVKARAVPGERANIKITYPEDLQLAEAYLEMKRRSA